MSKKEFMSLMLLKRDDFPFREWVALVYAREWTFMQGNEPSCEFTDDFKRMYSPAERARIQKMLKMMIFANYCGNVLFKRQWKQGSQSCSVSFGKDSE